MSSSSRHSYNPHRRQGSLQNVQGDGRRRTLSRARPRAVSHEDAYSYALRVAFLHYLLQPRKKRKEYIQTQKPPPRSSTSFMGEMASLGLGAGNHQQNFKLPKEFRDRLEDRMTGVLQGRETMAGYNDAAVKRTFAEAYTTFTARDFRSSVKEDRKIEPYLLMFYSGATKAQARGKDMSDKSYNFMADRHTAMFVRLMCSVLRDIGKSPELLLRLSAFESKILNNDQNLSIDTGQEDNNYHEVEIPLTYDIKDMHMVLLVARIFGKTNSQVQTDINSNKPTWTEVAALKDYKQYQHRLAFNLAGTLGPQDFDLESVFEEWKKNEGPHLGQIILEILSVKPELNRSTTSAAEKPLPTRPQSMFAMDQSYADFSKRLAEPENGLWGSEQPAGLGIVSLSLEDSAGIRGVDDPSYTFIPQEPRAVYKTILHFVMEYDLLNSDLSLPYTPLQPASSDLLVELAVRWRLPQYTRCVTLAEVATKQFLDETIGAEQLDRAYDYLRSPPPEVKKVPAIQFYNSGLEQIDRSRWTLTDFAAYQQALKDGHNFLLRELYEKLVRCYEPKNPSIKVVYAVIGGIEQDPAFSPRAEDADEFKQHLENGLRTAALEAYRRFVESSIPESQEQWDFSHVVQLGKSVDTLCEKIKKRYKSMDIEGVSPFKVLVESMFPVFEEDVREIISRVLAVARDRNVPVNLEDGVELYKELVRVRATHRQNLPGRPFAFHVEALLEDFVWRWIKNAEERMEEYVDNAIKQDQFQVRFRDQDGFASEEARHSSSIIDAFTLFSQTLAYIKDLKWEDRAHVARFKKNLAKAFSNAVGRYCEIVEQRFVKEMDRPTAQELAASNKSAQEKFLQYARDALANKERVEPFHFYPESFVKLNNVEYAMQALDKLESDMNVEEAAEILRNEEGAKQKGRRPNKYIFTIKIVEAEDLKACDPNGYSDPYVILGDEYQKRLAKTKYMEKTLNPRWNASVDIEVTGALNVIATIWDYDTFGDHDFVGRTSLKLDPYHFSDYLPREFWLDLDTQGRLLLRVSMEGERDDIQFYFAKAFRHLKRTERDMVRSITDKLSSQINHALSREVLRNLVGRNLTASIANVWKKRQSTMQASAPVDAEKALEHLYDYFNDNFEIMNLTLTSATMQAVMARLWKDVLMTIENLLVPPLSDKPSTQKPLTQAEVDVVFKWLQSLFNFFNAKDETGKEQGVPASVLKSPKWHDLQSLNFFYFESTETLIRTSEGMAQATAQRAKQLQQAALHNNRLSAPAALGPTYGSIGSMGTIRRGRSIMMNRNLGTIRKAKEEKRKELQADPSDDMILRILRMRPDAAHYLRARHTQKARQEAAAIAQAIVRQSTHQRLDSSQPAFGGALYGRNNLPRR